MDKRRPLLEPFVGEWALQVAFPGAAPVAGGRAIFAWMAGKRFLIQRWEVPAPSAPDGLAVIGFNEARGTFLQHYFDSCGVARLYEMTFAGGVWNLSRTEADFSPLDFSQRYTGRFSDDGSTIRGRWESSSDGRAWVHDFELIYTKTS